VSPAGPSRKQARRDAVFLLYQTEVTDLPMADLVQGQRLREGYAPDEFTVKAVAGVLREQEPLDAELEAHAEGWPLDRVAPLERSILRLALWEIRSGGTPPEVAIDEAVRLAKRYSTDEAGAFVNGVLGGIVRGDAADGEGSADDADHAAKTSEHNVPEAPEGGEEAEDG
jgi:transcription antitermination protein NusB